MTAKIGGVPLPDVEEVLLGAAVVVLPMRVRFRGLLRREAVLLRGPYGWAEFAPFDEYGDVEAARWLAAALAAAPGRRSRPGPRERHRAGGAGP